MAPLILCLSRDRRVGKGRDEEMTGWYDIGWVVVCQSVLFLVGLSCLFFYPCFDFPHALEFQSRQEGGREGREGDVSWNQSINQSCICINVIVVVRWKSKASLFLITRSKNQSLCTDGNTSFFFFFCCLSTVSRLVLTFTLKVTDG